MLEGVQVFWDWSDKRETEESSIDVGLVLPKEKHCKKKKNQKEWPVFFHSINWSFLIKSFFPPRNGTKMDFHKNFGHTERLLSVVIRFVSALPVSRKHHFYSTLFHFREVCKNQVKSSHRLLHNYGSWKLHDISFSVWGNKSARVVLGWRAVSTRLFWSCFG